MHRTTVLLLTLLAIGGPAAGAAHPAEFTQPIRVGVFKGHGASAGSIQNAFEALRIDPAIRPTLVSASDIQAGVLDGLDVILFPGGGGGRQFTDLGERGAALVRDFVLQKGKGAVGLCAGAYLLSDTPGYTCLRLCPLKAIDREHDERGHGLIGYTLAPEGNEFFPALAGRGNGRVYYYEGPILVPPGGIGVFAWTCMRTGFEAAFRISAGDHTIIVVTGNTHPEGVASRNWPEVIVPDCSEAVESYTWGYIKELYR